VADDIKTVAAECVGWPYREHGRDAHGVDCYGLFMYIAQRLGHVVCDFEYDGDWSKCGGNYFVEHYHEYGKRIKQKDLVPGDVIFMAIDGDIANHIGYYLGEGKFIHCIKRTGVVQSRLNERPFNKKVHSCYRFNP